MTHPKVFNCWLLLFPFLARLSWVFYQYLVWFWGVSNATVVKSRLARNFERLLLCLRENIASKWRFNACDKAWRTYKSKDYFIFYATQVVAHITAAWIHKQQHLEQQKQLVGVALHSKDKFRSTIPSILLKNFFEKKHSGLFWKNAIVREVGIREIAFFLLFTKEWAYWTCRQIVDNWQFSGV